MRLSILLSVLHLTFLTAALPASKNDTSLATTDSANGIIHPMLGFFSDRFLHGTYWQIGTFEYDMVDDKGNYITKEEDAKCLLTSEKPTMKKQGAILKYKSPRMEDDRIKWGMKYYKCWIYGNVRCEANRHDALWLLETSEEDLKQIGVQDKIMSTKCWWTG